MAAVLDIPRTKTLKRIYDAIDVSRSQNASVVLSGIPWETYNAFVDENMDKMLRPFLFFEDGNLLIMTIGSYHEYSKDAIAYLVKTLCSEFRIRSRSYGNTTYRREDIECGFEPDSCFYIASEPSVRDVLHLDLSIHPSPDLIIEIDITSLSSFKHSIFAAFGIPEIWRFDGEEAEILKLDAGKYVSVRNSISLPLLTAKKLTEFILQSRSFDSLDFEEMIRNWARSVK